MSSKLSHQRGQTINIGTVMSHPLVMPIKLLLDNVVPFSQSGHQGLVVGGKELDMLPILAELALQTITLEMLPC